jgi:hypothetical protein
MGEDQKAISRGKRQTLQLRITKNFSRRSKANRCSSKSKMGASESTASEKSSVVVVQNSKARHQARAFRFCIVDSGVNECNRLITTTDDNVEEQSVNCRNPHGEQNTISGLNCLPSLHGLSGLQSESARTSWRESRSNPVRARNHRSATEKVLGCESRPANAY